MRKIIKKVLPFFFACTLLCGCGSIKNSGENQNTGGGEVILTNADPDDKREVVTLGTWCEIPELMQEVNAFNETNEKYRIEVIAYPSMEYEDYFTNRAVRIMSGRGEDLLTGDMRMEDYIEKGALVDLLPYIRRDLREEDYIEVVLHAFEKDGGIYGVAPSFVISALYGRKADMGNGKIRFEDISGLMKQSGATTLMDRYPKDTLWYLYCCFGMNLTDRQELKEGILLAETYGYYGEGGYLSEVKLGRDALFLEITMNAPRSIMGVDGMESEVLPGAILQCGPISINNASEMKEGAWEFIRFLLSEECQEKMTRESFAGFPVSRKAFADKVETVFEEEARHYEEIQVEIPYTKERYLEIVESGLQGGKTLVMGIDYDAWLIVSEEVEAYYSGQKSLDAVLD
ncbi:MAG: extracellular solute-binding protein, partial [Acetatifactor sp.]